MQKNYSYLLTKYVVLTYNMILICVGSFFLMLTYKSLITFQWVWHIKFHESAI